MRVLFVTPAAEMSISDVARGYRLALERQGHYVADYHLGRRMAYHRKALPPEIAEDGAHLSRQASENVVVESLYHKVDVVIIASGLNFHPVGMWLLGEVGIPVAVILTESPYDDDSQAQFCDLSRFQSKIDLTVFTNDLFSSRTRGWHHLPPAFEPRIHRPVDPNPDEARDVVMVGTGWGERQTFLEAVDWTDIDMKLFGIWPGVTEQTGSPLLPHLIPLVVSNEHIASIYCSAKVCPSFNRRNPDALTPGPRSYEIAACGAFQISDPRQGMTELFGDSVPIFDSPERMRDLIVYYTRNEQERLDMAAEARRRVSDQTFDHRAADLMAVLSDKLGIKAEPDVPVDLEPAMEGSTA